jgi:hypothetical protein
MAGLTGSYRFFLLKKNPGFIMVAVLTLAVAIRESYFRRILGTTPGQYQKANFFRARPLITAEKVPGVPVPQRREVIAAPGQTSRRRGYPRCPQ